MLDMHTHILPNVDDGAKDINVALEMIKEEIKNGVKTVVLTPHISFKSTIIYDKVEILNRYNLFKEACKDLDVRLLLGAEVYYAQGVLEQAVNGELLTMNDSKYILLEFNLVFENDDIDEVTFNFLMKGFKPILAHLERYPYMTIDKAHKIKNTGGLIQINTSSILGDNGSSCKKLALKMLKEGLVDFIASDCHSMGLRKPNLHKVKKYIDKYSIKADESFFG